MRLQKGRAIEEAIRRATGARMPGREKLLLAAAQAMRALRRAESPLDPLACDLLADDDLCYLLRQDDALGLISQALSARELARAYRATTTQRRKFTAAEIPAVTQLFTPRWVIEFLLQNSLGRVWIEMHPHSRLPSRWDRLIQSGASERSRRPLRPLRILDPACGTMNFGLVAREMLAAIPVEGPAPHELLGIDIDPLALSLADETLDLHRKDEARRNWRLAQRDFIREPLPTDWPEEFDIIATNPPYLAARNLPRKIVADHKSRHPHAWRDQYACFIDRAIDLLAPGGRVAMLTMQSFMFTAGYQRLRESIFARCAIEVIAHFGPGLFDVGNPGTLQTVAFVLRREDEAAKRASQRVVALRLVDARDKELALRRARPIELRQDALASSPRSAWSYWLTAQQRRLFATLPRLREHSPPRQGLATTDNARFVRHWWEVSPTSHDAPLRPSADTWFPYVKSGRFRRWHETPRHRVNWRDDGREIKSAIVQRYPYLKGKWQWVAKNARHYFSSGVTYSYLTSGRFSARMLEAGAIFDVAGSSLFPEDPLTTLAVLNSSVARELLGAINPTVNFQVGDVGELPAPRGTSETLRDDVRRAIEITRAFDRFDETSPEFVAPLPWRNAAQMHQEMIDELSRLETRIDRAVADLYGCDSCEGAAITRSFDSGDLARRWISYVLRQMLSDRGSAMQIFPLRATVRREIQSRLQLLTGSSCCICEAASGLERFLARDFSGWHTSLYRKRPVVWVFGSPRDRLIAVLHDHATRQVVRSIARRVGRSIDPQWERCIDDGVAISLAPLCGTLADHELARALSPVRQKLLDGEFAWSETARRMPATSAVR